MEACVGAHHLSRKLQMLGHDARLMPAKYVRDPEGVAYEYPARSVLTRNEPHRVLTDGCTNHSLCALPSGRMTTVVDELRAHRVRRAQDLLRLGVGPSDDDLVIAHADGAMVTPIYISQLWARKIAKTRLARLRFHDLRHAHATHMLANGVHPKVASERLGHSKVGITLDLYSHVIPGMQEDAAAMVDRALTAARDKGRK
jgi:hypothetical protein